jgi:glycerophosphoryl diester phosphodiesterase
VSEKVIVESFDLTAIAQIKEKLQGARTAALFEPKVSTPRLFFANSIIRQAKAAHVDEIALHRSLATERLVRPLREAGFGVSVWTVDSPHWIERARVLKIDAIITNVPDRLLRRRDELAGIEAAK